MCANTLGDTGSFICYQLGASVHTQSDSRPYASVALDYVVNYNKPILLICLRLTGCYVGYRTVLCVNVYILDSSVTQTTHFLLKARD